MTYHLSIQTSPGMAAGETLIETGDYSLRFELDHARGPLLAVGVADEEHTALCLIYFPCYTRPIEHIVAVYRSARYLDGAEEHIIDHPDSDRIAILLDNSPLPQQISILERIACEYASTLGIHIQR